MIFTILLDQPWQCTQEKKSMNLDAMPSDKQTEQTERDIWGTD